jgi:membrane-associated protease RseP (regulator of RpoE activity)
MHADLKKWGADLDFNLFTTTTADRDRFRTKGCDEHSLVGDPLFVDAAKGDFRVRDQSPALQIGFTNFPMDQFGVLKPELRAIARTPSLALGEAEKSQRDGKIHDWRGVKLKNIVGLDEVSAYGTAGEAGVLVMEIPPENPLAKAGLRKGDVIVQVNELALDEYAWLEWAEEPHRLLIFRNQTLMEIKP